MDDQSAAPGLIDLILSDAGGGTSVDKVRGVLGAAAAIVPEDEDTAQLLSLFTMVSATGVIERAIPQDPDQLDALLLRGAELFLQMRSDHWEPLFIGAAADVGSPAPRPGVQVPIHVEHEPGQ